MLTNDINTVNSTPSNCAFVFYKLNTVRFLRSSGLHQNPETKEFLNVNIFGGKCNIRNMIQLLLKKKKKLTTATLILRVCKPLLAYDLRVIVFAQCIYCFQVCFCRPCRITGVNISVLLIFIETVQLLPCNN